jgi:8-oxo-dGTP diphosphatase
MKAASAVVYRPESETFLLVKRADTKEMNPGKWEFPGGFVEDDETEREAALRELREETGLAGEIVKSGGTGKVETPVGTLEITPFLVVVEDEEVELSREHSDFEWVQLDELDGFDTVKGLEKELGAVGIER